MGNNLMRPCEQELGDDGEEELLFNRKYSVVGSRRRKAFCNYSLVRCWENNDRKEILIGPLIFLRKKSMAWLAYWAPWCVSLNPDEDLIDLCTACSSSSDLSVLLFDFPSFWLGEMINKKVSCWPLNETINLLEMCLLRSWVNWAKFVPSHRPLYN